MLDETTCTKPVVEEQDGADEESSARADDDDGAKDCDGDVETPETTDPQKQSTLEDDDTSSSTCSSTKEGRTTTTTSMDQNNTVKFDQALPLIHTIPSRTALTVEEKDNIWYHRLEKQAMLQGALKTAVDLPPSDDMARGLEQLTYEGGNSSQIARERLYSRFLREQIRLKQRQQHSSFIQREEALARISCAATRRWREEATHRGYLDAVAANENYKGEVNAVETSKARGGMLQGFMGWLGNNHAN